MIGRVLANRYEIQERIGVGGMAYVYRALDRNTQKLVAVKILREELAHDDEFVQRFEREALAASKMSHPNVVNLLDVGMEEDMRYIVIEYVSGRSLKEIIRESGGGLRNEMAGQITIRILSALQHAHQNGIIHRDIKPQNILLDKEGVIKVLDFGIARMLNDAQVQERTIGSVHYFSPEQARGDTADEKSDLYSVGVVLYEMLTGKVPFVGDTSVSVAMQHLQDKPVSPAELNPGVSEALSRIALKAMEKEPADRYPDASAMIRAIRGALRQSGPEPAAPKANPATPENTADPEKERRIARRVKWMRRALTGAFSGLLLFVIGLLVYTMVGNLIHSIMDRTIMPNVTNMSKQPAIDLLEERGFVVHTRERSVEIGAEGIIIAQEPESGTYLKKGDPVYVTISVSEYDLFMPDLSRMQLSMAQQVIKDSKLVLENWIAVPSEARESQVIAQVPEAGSKIKYGQAVALRVSGGQVIVPDFVHQTETAAMQSIPSAMVLSDILWKTVQDSQLDRVVLAQEPPAYEKVMLNQALTLTIGKLEERIYMAEHTLSFQFDEATQVRVVLIEADDSQTLQYSAMHPAGKSEAHFTIRGPTEGVKTCRLYYDDALSETFEVTLVRESTP